MTTISPRAWLLALLPACAAVGCGNGNGPHGPPPQAVPTVSVSAPVRKVVTDYEDFPGRIEAVQSVEIRARVTGYLTKINFREGTEVKKGDLLFEIDARPYEAELARAAGSVLQGEGRVERLERDHRRASGLVERGALSREDFDKVQGDRTEAKGTLEVARANLAMARLSLDWTRVYAPLSGKISRRFIDAGNMVKADETALTTIVATDKVYAYFDLDERNTLYAQRLLREGKVKWSPDHPLPVLLGLADEEGKFPRTGLIDFADNRVDPDTGTWRLRATFENPDKTLCPGLYVRMRLPMGNPYEAMLIAYQALGTDQGEKFLYVLRSAKDKEGKSFETVDYRRVKVGKLHDGLRVILPPEYKEEKGRRVLAYGLEPGDKVVVNGLQRVRPGMPVKARVVPMPRLDTPGASAATNSETRNSKSETNPKSEKENPKRTQ